MSGDHILWLPPHAGDSGDETSGWDPEVAKRLAEYLAAFTKMRATPPPPRREPCDP